MHFASLSALPSSALSTLLSVASMTLFTSFACPPAVSADSPDGKVVEESSKSNLPKRVPRNATTPNYTAEMAASDHLLAAIFGGQDAVGAANGFEPTGLSNQYPVYRGDLIGDNGTILEGHLSYAMHLYGSIDGTGNSPLYVPAGFTSHSNGPTPTDAAVTFYYPRLGDLTNVTVAVFHVANFQITNEGTRVRIGNIGGPGGSNPFYRHSHIEFYRGNTGLPGAKARHSLRINPTTVFASASQLARL